MIATRYAVCGPQVIHETIDGEVVIINLETGNYYSLRGTGAFVWEGIVAGVGATAIADGLVTAFDGLDAAPDLSAFLTSLEREGLVARSTEPDGAPPPPAASANAPRGAYAPPALEGFTDMQDLILLDPVHEVDETFGWPRTKPADQA